MHEKFADGLRAANFVGSGLLSDVKEATLELTLESPRGGQRRVCESKEAGRVLHDLCQRFPRASVYYHPESAYGFVAQIRCHCSDEKAPGCCRADGRDRAWVLVMLKPDAGADVRALHEAIQEQAKKEAHEYSHVPEDPHEHHRTPKPVHKKQKGNRKSKKKSLLDWFRSAML